MIKKILSNPMSESLKAIMPKAVEIMGSAIISDEDDFKDQLFTRAVHAAIVTAVTGIATPLTITPKIEDGVVIGFSMGVDGDKINDVPAEQILGSIMKTVIFYANKEHEMLNLHGFLDDLLKGFSDDKSASDDDVSVNTEESVANDTQKPEDQIAS